MFRTRSHSALASLIPMNLWEREDTSLDIAMAQLKTWQSEASSAVKLTNRDQPEKWVEFGIKGKK